jgi:hypothetical protein
MTTAENRRPRALLWLALLATAIVVFNFFFLLRDEEAPDAQPPEDGLTYLQRVAPLLEAGGDLVARLNTTNDLSAAFAAAADLRARWAGVRTAAGYDRAQHDGLILTFSRFLNLLQSAEVLSSALSELGTDGAVVADERRTELTFALQTVHGTETAAQLLAKTGLTLDQLLTRTNLARELAAGLEQAGAQHEKARQVLAQLASAGPL